MHLKFAVFFGFSHDRKRLPCLASAGSVRCLDGDVRFPILHLASEVSEVCRSMCCSILMPQKNAANWNMD